MNEWNDSKTVKKAEWQRYVCASIKEKEKILVKYVSLMLNDCYENDLLKQKNCWYWQYKSEITKPNEIMKLSKEMMI